MQFQFDSVVFGNIYFTFHSRTVQLLPIIMSEGSAAVPKKPRLCEAVVGDKLINEQLEAESRSLFFDILPENTLDNIVRFFSRSPRAVNWENHTYLEDIYDLYDVEGELGGFLSGRFTGVNVIDEVQQPIYISGPILEKEAIIASTAPFLLKLCSSGRVVPSFQTLILGYLLFEDEERAPSTPVSVHEDRRRCLEKFGESVVSLYISASLVREIRAYCTNLRHLYLSGSMLYKTDLRMFWESVGNHLETISARDVSQPSLIADYCPNIKHLEILRSANPTGVSKCIASYGEQIKTAKILISTESDLRLIQSACPNARLSIIAYSQENLRLALDVFGRQLGSVELYFYQDEEQYADWTSCTNIESVKFDRYPSFATIRGFMAKPKSLLKSIVLYLRPEKEDNGDWKSLIPLIARGTGALEKFKLMCPEPSPGMFNTLVERNKTLSYVQVSFDCVLPDVKKVDVMGTFVKCPALKKLDLDDADSMVDIEDTNLKTRIEDLLRPVRHRRVRITAFGAVYFEAAPNPL